MILNRVLSKSLKNLIEYDVLKLQRTPESRSSQGFSKEAPKCPPSDGLEVVPNQTTNEEKVPCFEHPDFSRSMPYFIWVFENLCKVRRGSEVSPLRRPESRPKSIT